MSGIKNRTTDYSKTGCAECTVFACPEECFNAHEGSMIALQKLIRAMGKEGDVHIVRER